MSYNRYQRGSEKLKEVNGEAGERASKNVKDIAPDRARYTIRFACGNRVGTGLHA
ncbi:MAG: hypothetical protein WBG50_05135 [Desulfomonilaceae bacterium]